MTVEAKIINKNIESLKAVTEPIELPIPETNGTIKIPSLTLIDGTFINYDCTTLDISETKDYYKYDATKIKENNKLYLYSDENRTQKVDKVNKGDEKYYFVGGESYNEGEETTKTPMEPEHIGLASIDGIQIESATKGYKFKVPSSFESNIIELKGYYKSENTICNEINVE